MDFGETLQGFHIFVTDSYVFSFKMHYLWIAGVDVRRDFAPRLGNSR